MYKPLFALLCTGSALAAGAQTDSAALFLQKGLAEKSAGRVMESYKYFDRAYFYNQSERQIVSELADVLFVLKRYAPARDTYQQLEKLGVADAALYQRLSELSLNLRQFPDAIRYAQALKKIDPSQAIAFRIGKAHYESENYGEAIRFLNDAIREEPANREAPYLIARAYSDMSNFKTALPFFEKAIALDSTNSRLYYEAGLIYYAARDDKNALRCLLLAAEKGYKKDPEYLENLAIAYVSNKQFDAGITIMKESLRRRPTDLLLLNSIAEACYDAKKWDDAIGYWDRILEQENDNASALYMIGMSYLKKGEKEKGQSLCNKAIDMDPSLAGKRQELGNTQW